MKQRSPILTRLLLLAVLALSSISSGENSASESQALGKLTVDVEGLRSSRGSIALALFDNRDAFDRRRDAVRAGFVKARKKDSQWVVANLPPGEYALVAYHDKNDNGELDRRKMFGIPAEPYGFSNDARGKFGPPPFEAARFEVTGESNHITIRLR